MRKGASLANKPTWASTLSPPALCSYRQASAASTPVRWSSITQLSCYCIQSANPNMCFLLPPLIIPLDPTQMLSNTNSNFMFTFKILLLQP